MYLDKFFIYWKTFHEEILEYYFIPEKLKLKNVAYNELHLVEYSKLKSDVIGEVTKIVNFLGLPMTKFIEDCLMKNRDGFYKRSHNFSWKDSSKTAIFSSIFRINLGSCHFMTNQNDDLMMQSLSLTFKNLNL